MAILRYFPGVFNQIIGRNNKGTYSYAKIIIIYCHLRTFNQLVTNITSRKYNIYTNLTSQGSLFVSYRVYLIGLSIQDLYLSKICQIIDLYLFSSIQFRKSKFSYFNSEKKIYVLDISVFNTEIIVTYRANTPGVNIYLT